MPYVTDNSQPCYMPRVTDSGQIIDQHGLIRIRWTPNRTKNTKKDGKLTSFALSFHFCLRVGPDFANINQYDHKYWVDLNLIR